MSSPPPATIRPLPAAGPLPAGRLQLVAILAELLKAGLISAENAQRARLAGAEQRAADLHPLALLAELKLAAHGTGDAMSIEALAEWLAARAGLP